MARYEFEDAHGDTCRLLTREDCGSYSDSIMKDGIAVIEFVPRNNPDYGMQFIVLTELQLKTLHIVAGYGADWDLSAANRAAKP